MTGYVFSTHQPYTLPIYRWYHPTAGDHFYTKEVDGEFAPQLGYQNEGIGFYIYLDAQPGTIALYRWYHDGYADHFYTSDSSGEFAPQLGYHLEMITGYLYPDDGWLRAPLFRWCYCGKPLPANRLSHIRMENLSFEGAGADPSFIRRRFIDLGAFGEVYEVIIHLSSRSLIV